MTWISFGLKLFWGCCWCLIKQIVFSRHILTNLRPFSQCEPPDSEITVTLSISHAAAHPWRPSDQVLGNHAPLTGSLPSHLFGRWTHSSSPPVLAAPTDAIIKKNHKYAAEIISSAVTRSSSTYKSRFVYLKSRQRTVKRRFPHPPLVHRSCEIWT